MATEPETTLDPAPAPPVVADTPEPEPEDTGKDTPEPPKVDWEARYRAQQAELTRTQQSLAEIRKTAPTTGESSDDYRAKWEQSEWARAEAVHGPEVIGAYDSFYRVFSTDATPMGAISALESYHQARLSGQSPAQAAAPPAAAPPAAPPSVDSNRSDASPDTDLDHQIEGAKEKGDLTGYIGGLLRRAGRT